MASANETVIARELEEAGSAIPFACLGLHESESGKGLVLRAWQPGADQVAVTDASRQRSLGAMTQVGSSGLFVLQLPRRKRLFRYWLDVRCAGRTMRLSDPYQFRAALTGEQDIDGSRLYRSLGAHLCRTKRDSTGSEEGVLFAVFAPSARAVSVVGNFNQWDPRCHPMQGSGQGVWRLFVPGITAGELYKFAIKGPRGKPLPTKTDPFGIFTEQPPGHASIVYDRRAYRWQDERWCRRRDEAGYRDDSPVSIYEVHLASWQRHNDGRHLSYRELADELIPYVKDMGFTHIELLPIMEHPFLGSWGYQTTGMFAPTTRFGAPDDFKEFVDRCHEAELGVILDWVPAHFPRDEHALARFDGTALFEHSDPRRGWHPDWDTYIYDYGKPFVRDFLVSSSLFWLEEFHVDGIRVDAVASMLYLDYSREEGQWLPNVHGGNENLDAILFLREMNEVLHRERPGVLTMAEESTSWPKVSRPTYEGGLGFGFKWNMGWMHDTLSYMSRDPVHRRFHHGELTFGMLYAYSEHFILPLSHDEVVHGKGSLLGKMPGDAWQKHANLRLYLAFMFAYPGKKLLFMGGEFGQLREWNHDAQLDWHLLDDPRHRGMHRLVKDLNGLYTSMPALHEHDCHSDGFRWIDHANAKMSVISFLRSAGESSRPVIVVSNMTPAVHRDFTIGAPSGGEYIELLNTDSESYGGSNVGNAGAVQAIDVPADGMPYSLKLTIPPLATIYLAQGKPGR